MFSFTNTHQFQYLVHGNELSGSSGTIASPMFPHSYRHTVNRGSGSQNVEITWRITVSEDMTIRIRFDTFEIRSAYGINVNERCEAYLAVSIYQTIVIRAEFEHTSSICYKNK